MGRPAPATSGGGDSSMASAEPRPASGPPEYPAGPTDQRLKPDFSKGVTTGEYYRARVDYLRRLTRDVYLRQGKKNPAWDDAALKFLDATVAATSYGATVPVCTLKPPSAAALRAMGAAVRKAGCDDPVVYARYLGVVAPQSIRDPEEVKQAMQMLDTLRSRHVPPMLVALAARDAHRACLLLREDRAAEEKILMEAVLAAVSAKEYPGIDRQLVLFYAHEALGVLPTSRRVVFNAQHAHRLSRTAAPARFTTASPRTRTSIRGCGTCSWYWWKSSTAWRRRPWGARNSTSRPPGARRGSPQAAPATPRRGLPHARPGRARQR